MMSQHRVRLIGFGQRLQFLAAELHFQGLDGIFQLLYFAGADNGRGDARLVQQPGQGNLRIRYALALGDFRQFPNRKRV